MPFEDYERHKENINISGNLLDPDILQNRTGSESEIKVNQKRFSVESFCS